MAATVADGYRATPVGTICGRFDAAIARPIIAFIVHFRKLLGINTIALSSDVFQNVWLLEAAKMLLEAEGFDMLHHKLVPPNDGGNRTWTGHYCGSRKRQYSTSFSVRRAV